MQPAGPNSPQSPLTYGVFNVPIPPLLRSKFLKLATEYNNREVYDGFKQILKDHVQQRTDVGGAGSRIKQLVDDNTELRQGVKRLKMEVKVTNFVQKMKGRLTINEYMRYNEILEGFPSRQPSMVKMVEEIAVLFANHMDLFVDFCELFPGGSNLSG